jgi:hypothetical protein
MPDSHPRDQAARRGTQSPYDTHTLRERARQWRIEAAKVTNHAMREFCLDEADKCEHRVRRSLYTPIVREYSVLCP